MEENKQMNPVEKGQKDKPTKKVRWKFDPDSSMMFVSKERSELAEVEARFKFKIVIFKDKDTHIESMKITNYVIDRDIVANGDWEAADGKENGSIVTSIVSLGQDIRNFKKFGVVIGDTYYRDLAREIEREYANIRVDEVVLSEDDKRYNDLMEEVKRFFNEYKENDFITETFCYIPVNEFNGLAFDCGYFEYEMRDLRSQLEQSGCIFVKSGRYAVLKRISGKPQRVVAFYREKLGIEMPVKSTKKQAEKSGADE